MTLKKTKFGDYEKRCNFHVFGFAVYIVFTSDMTQSITSRYNDVNIEQSFDALHAREKGKPYSHLFFKIGNCTNGMAAHESWHVVRFMLHDWAHCELDNETVAYHLGYLVDHVTMFRNDLVDKGVGVKSDSKEVPNERGPRPKQLSRFDEKAEAENNQESVPQTEGSNSGRCCS